MSDPAPQTLGPALPARLPSVEALERVTRATRAVSVPVRLILKRWLREVEVVGEEHLSSGPALVLTNHCSPLDAVLLGAHLSRPLHFLVTEPAMFPSPMAQLMAWLGQVPKRKLEAEARTMRTLKGWCDAGGIAAVFPEGEFTMDGRVGRLQPGLRQLIEYLGVPVVVVRQVNGHRFWPAWAKHPRRTKVRLEVDAPRVFSPGEDVDEAVAQALTVDLKVCESWPVSGSNLAEGLARVLAWCPWCGASPPNDAANTFSCSACGASWNVGADNMLRNEQETLSLYEAFLLMQARLAERWSRGVALKTAGEAEVWDASRPQWAQIGKGYLSLGDGALSLGTWRLPLSEVLTHTLDWGNHIVLRTRRQRLALRFSTDARAIWHLALEAVYSQR